MRKVNFQLVLKECVLPEYFVFKKLKNLVEALPEFSIDSEQVKESIETQPLIKYKSINRYLLRFSVDFGFTDTQNLDLLIAKDLILKFGQSFRDETDIVEGVFRFADDIMLDEIIKFHKEVFEIEMKVREVLNHILSCNLSENNLFDFIKEFEGTTLSNRKIRDDKNHREKLWDKFLENELHYILFTEYGYFSKPKPLDAKRIYEFIGGCSDFDQLKGKIQERGITDKLNSEHKLFVESLSTKIRPIEELRNEIMHNRSIKDNSDLKLEQNKAFQDAKTEISSLIDNFWEQEKTNSAGQFEQAEFILKTLIKSLPEEKTFPIYYTDLNFEDQEAEDKEELTSQFLDIINDNLMIKDQEALEELINYKIDEIDELTDSKQNPPIGTVGFFI